MNISDAISDVMDGYLVTDDGWDGKDMFIFMVPGSAFVVNRPPLLGIFEEGTGIDYLPHIDIRDSEGYISPWTPSQKDMFSNGWRRMPHEFNPAQ